MARRNQNRTKSNQNVEDTIGEFLVIHKDGPHVERVDTVEWHDFDVRQEAVFRCLCVFQKQGVAVDNTTLIATLIAKKHLAARNLTISRVDAERRLRGRGSQRGKDRRTLSMNAYGGDSTQSLDPSGTALVECEPCCPDADRVFDDIEHDYMGQVRTLYTSATPTEQKAIRVLLEWQRRKDCGENCYPLRKTIYKLRDKLAAEGSHFNLNPRYL